MPEGGVLRDLSQPIRQGAIPYPGDPEVRVEPALTLETDGVAVTRIAMGSHTATHVDAPSHTVPGGRTMADVTLDELVGDALVLRVLGLADRDAYGWDAIEAANEIPEALPSIVLLDTGWARYFGDERQLRHPVLEADAAAELMRRGMQVLAVDTMNPDRTAASSSAFPVHDVVLGGDGLIVENVCGLHGLPRRVRVGFFPLRLADDGAPVRGVAFLP